MMEVARALSFQKPGLSESCLSFWILSRRLSTSKKPPYPGNAGPHIIQFFDCHRAQMYAKRLKFDPDSYRDRYLRFAIAKLAKEAEQRHCEVGIFRS